jgi:hemoglobin
MLRFLCTLLLAATAAIYHGVSEAQSADAGLYQAFGAKNGLATLMNAFVERLAVDDRTRVYFANADKPRLKEQLTEQLCMLAGGPCVYRGAQMRGVHRGLEIGRSDFNALVEVLQDCMDAQGIPFTTQNGMLARLAPMHREIVTRE